MPRAEQPIIAIDRDGTLIEEGDYLTDPRRVKLIPGAVRGLQRLQAAGFRVVVLSNQSGVARGFITPLQLKRVNQRFLQLLKANKVSLDGYYWCPHAPGDRCDCRKPRLGMLKQAGHDLQQDWRQAVSIGDRPSDVQIGQRSGGKGILVLTGYGRRWNKTDVKPDYKAKDFLQAAKWILNRYGKKGKR